MEKIYFDNASTSFKKPDSVLKAVYTYMSEVGVNASRGGYESAYELEGKIFETRKLVCEFFGSKKAKNVVFTKNITESLNLILFGFLKAGDKVLISGFEHNAVLRPLHILSKKGVKYEIIKSNVDGSIDLEDAKNLIDKNTKAIVCTHVSNVSGTILPIEEIGKICKDYCLEFILDSAASAGILDINMEKMNISALCFTGHKGLLGPQGIGGIVFKDGFDEKIEPIIFGGTGSLSHELDMPIFLPDKFEAGTLNLPAVYGLYEGIKFINQVGRENIFAHENYLANYFINALSEDKIIKKINILGIDRARTGTVSIFFDNKDMAEAAFLLDKEYKIMTRVGLHCAPLAHKTFHTYPKGSIRFSFGYFNTKDEIDIAIKALNNILFEDKFIY